MDYRKIILILSNLRSLYNVGSLFRTADAFNVEKIYLCGITGIPDSLRGDRISKTALGAEKYIPWEYKKRTGDVVKELKKNRWQIVALEQSQKAQKLGKVKLKDKVALIVGHEKKGVSRSVLQKSDIILEIPMHGRKKSLNVSVAGGIGLYVARNS